ncbi:flagellar basal body L-ring protein FlgH [Arenimonas sp.]|uniref:flagellar basal body L-ring protein FlgH n=1 Tax=Arenimonas sp. TaxID=1872635 RepID=UPI0039E27FD2
MRTEQSLRLAVALLALMAVPLVMASPRSSLIDPATFRGPAADQRAYRIGDVLTVYVLETAHARSQAGTGAERNTDIGIALHAPSTAYEADLGVRNKNNGAAQTQRIGELRAQLSVRVVALEPNGLLRVSGGQMLAVNGEQQRITLSGLVRPEDITAGNIVWSSRLAEAEVSLSGKGVVSEAQKRSLIARIVQWLGL